MKTPYEEGMESALKFDGADSLPCPYKQGTPEHDAWWQAFSDVTEAVIADKLVG